MLPLRNAKFFGRESILNEIGQTLRNSPSATEPIAITLNGLGGIGKSQIAREYAYRWKAQYGIILWIASETALSLDQSLRKAAVELKLANVSQTDSLQNKVAVRGKLERSDTPWLVIFDNLNDASAIEDFWPRGGLGSIIVTSVISDVVFNLNPYVIKVPAFSEEEAIGCFLDQLALDNTDELNKNSAAKINQELGGHPLAIVRVAAFARSCKFRIEECAEQIELALDEARDSSPIKNYDDYLKDICTVWKMSFKKLSEKPQTMSLLGMLSYLAAETIPEVLFTPNLSRGQKQDAFDQITFLLYHAFPKQDKGQYLHDHWEQGNLFVNHIVTLNRHYLDTSSSPQIFPSLHYIRLLSNCAWFLYEKGNNIEARTIIIGGLNACEKLKRKSKSDEMHLIYAHMLNTSALLDGIRGFFDSQIEKLNLVLEIRKRVLAENHEEISGVLNNLCLAYENAMQFSKALEYREKSLEVCWKHPESRSRDTKIKKRDLTLTRLLLATDRPEEAKDLFPGLLQYFESINNWFLIGQLFIPWGNYQFAVRDFQGSKESFLYALKQYEDVGKVMYHPDAAACLYKIGRAALEEGDLVYAIEKFREAIRRLQLADPKSPQIGRVYFMLSKALKKMGVDNTDEMRTVEKEIRDIVQALRPQHDSSVEITEALLDSLVSGIIR
ncbi:P-loop containing nucleoside triphosphate hydrolase protein [Trichoderma pleuroticola]